MKQLSDQNHYEVLELEPGCSAEVIEGAYAKAKAMCEPGALALYALADPGEALALRSRIEEAHAALSDVVRRRAYDERQGFSTASAPALPATPKSPGPSVEVASTGLPATPKPPAPSTEVAIPALPAAPAPREPSTEVLAPAVTPGPAEALAEIQPPIAVVIAPEPAEKPAAAPPPEPKPATDAPENKPVRKTEAELPADGAVTGDALRRVREALGLSLKDVEGRTKIGKFHLENIEKEKYAALPAQVYLRGFLMSLARELKLDPVRVAKSYLEQMKQKLAAAKPE